MPLRTTHLTPSQLPDGLIGVGVERTFMLMMRYPETIKCVAAILLHDNGLTLERVKTLIEELQTQHPAFKAEIEAIIIKQQDPKATYTLTPATAFLSVDRNRYVRWAQVEKPTDGHTTPIFYQII